MPRLAELEARVASIGELDEVVGAMRALAAVRMRQATEALQAARQHAVTIRAALDAARSLVPDALVPSPAGDALVIVFCTEHGFAGAFNERLLDQATEAARDPLVVVGSRGALLAAERGLDVAASVPAASHPSGALDVARRTAAAISASLDRRPLGRADVIYGHGAATGVPRIDRARLLPVEPANPRPAGFPPLHHLEPSLLVEALVAELVVAELARIAIESLAAESSARMQAMSAARDNIERKLADLRRAEHRARQDQVTTELLDLITGAEATTARQQLPQQPARIVPV